ncbi:MAG: HD domain-containing protein [Candidatus Atribacteria bacterium]|jgi:predicted HD superfamily hydrolase involved in NAD metabolism|nr:HD domain-containing protein [Candidatus Atribacteria bacterium]
MDLEEIKDKLKDIMEKNRYEHACRVSSVAEQIAEYYNLPIKSVKISGLIHDCAKDYSDSHMKSLIKKYNIRLNEVERHIPKIWHAYVGAEMAKEVFQIEDQEIVDAVKYHSTASVKLGLIGKIVYIADKIEPDRNLTKIKKLWPLVYKDIDLAMLELLDQELEYLISKRLVVHPDTIGARNKIIIEKGY